MIKINRATKDHICDLIYKLIQDMEELGNMCDVFMLEENWAQIKAK
jgi:hypothetical protein